MSSSGVESKKRARLNPSETFQAWVFQLWECAYAGVLIVIPYLLLALTPTLWAPNLWYMWMYSITIVEAPNPYLFEQGMNLNHTQCLTRTEKLTAISGSAATASGFYGPGAYLAWYLTAIVTSLSSILSLKCAKSNEKLPFLDGEIFATILYPLVATLDVIVRLIRCKVDPGISAAAFVLVSSLAVFGPACRLSRIEASEMEWFEWPTRRGFGWLLPKWLFEAVLQAILGEPYVAIWTIAAQWAIRFVVFLYSGVVTETLSDRYPYHILQCRPPVERAVVFVLAQIAFGAVLLSREGTFWPRSGASLWDLDQAATLVCSVLTIAYMRRERLVSVVQRVSRRARGYSLVAPTAGF